MAGVSVIGDAVMLFDLGVRIWSFISDVRHAQDDFIMLRNEAHCLRKFSLQDPRNTLESTLDQSHENMTWQY